MNEDREGQEEERKEREWRAERESDREAGAQGRVVTELFLGPDLPPRTGPPVHSRAPGKGKGGASGHWGGGHTG